MRGWVYIITNDSMPSLLKVGFSRKDPEQRAIELGQGNTGVPTPYKVIYEVLVESPHQVEQKTHLTLKDSNVGKEWFSCTIDDAVSAIKLHANELLIENKKFDFVDSDEDENKPSDIDDHDKNEEKPSNPTQMVFDRMAYSSKFGFFSTLKFQYLCPNCDNQFVEIIKFVNAFDYTKCPECGHEAFLNATFTENAKPYVFLKSKAAEIQSIKKARQSEFQPMSNKPKPTSEEEWASILDYADKYINKD